MERDASEARPQRLRRAGVCELHKGLSQLLPERVPNTLLLQALCTQVLSQHCSFSLPCRVVQNWLGCRVLRDVVSCTYMLILGFMLRWVPSSSPTGPAFFLAHSGSFYQTQLACHLLQEALS